MTWCLLLFKGFFLTLTIVWFREETLINWIWMRWKSKNIECLHKTLSRSSCSPKTCAGLTLVWPPHVSSSSSDYPHTSMVPPIVENILDKEIQLVSMDLVVFVCCCPEIYWTKYSVHIDTVSNAGMPFWWCNPLQLLTMLIPTFT